MTRSFVLVLAAQSAARRRLKLRRSVEIEDRQRAWRLGVKRTPQPSLHPEAASCPVAPAGQDPACSLRLGSSLRATPAGCFIAGQRGHPRRTPSRGTVTEQYNSLKCRAAFGALVRHGPHLSLQLLPLRPGTPLAIAVQLLVPCASTRRYNSSSSCGAGQTRLRRLKGSDQF